MPTALELGHAGWQRYLEAAQRRPGPPAVTAAERNERQKLMRCIHNVASVLKTRFGARRVVLFGSLVHAAWFRSAADVDLAVSGLAAEHYWQAWQVAEEIIADRFVDLLTLETARESLRPSIDRHGIEL
jgi:predicted nucleotidyltransferase